MAGEEQIDIKKLEKEKKELAAEMEKLSGEIDTMYKSCQAITKQFDSNKLKKTDDKELEAVS